MGVDLAPDEVAYRCNLVTVDDDGTMVDFAAGHLTSEQSHPIVAALDAALGDGRDGVRFHPGVEYRHLCVVPGDLADAECVPPHDLTGQPAVLPDRARGARSSPRSWTRREPVVRGRRGRGRLGRHADLAVGPGRRARAARLRRPLRRRAAGCRRRSTSCAGSACSRASRCSTSPARPPGFDNDYAAQRDACARVARRPRLLPPPRRGHRRSRATRARSTRRSRRSSAGTPRSSARSSTALGGEPFRVLLLPDHATPCRVAHAHVGAGAVPPLRLRRARARAASTPSAASPDSAPVRRARPHGAPARADAARCSLEPCRGR